MKCIFMRLQILAVAVAASLCVPVNATTHVDHSILDKLGDGVAMEARTGQIRFSGRADGNYYRAYACHGFATARAVIGAIPKADGQRGTVARQAAAMRTALRRLDCSPARGSFRVTALGPEVWINHGYEAEEDWLAVAAVNIRGRKLGLVIDVSPYAPIQ